jgi:hypothetical protein
MNFHSPTAPPMKFSLAVSGNGRLIPRFVEAVKLEYRGIRIYNRNEEANRPPSSHPIPSHPEVADIDAVFILAGAGESITLRSRQEHRYFNCVSDPALAHERSLAFLLKRIVLAVQELIEDKQ